MGGKTKNDNIQQVNFEEVQASLAQNSQVSAFCIMCGLHFITVLGILLYVLLRIGLSSEPI